MSDLWGDYNKRLEYFTVGETTTADLTYAVHVSLKYKYIFNETPKVACSTIKLTLQRMELEDPGFERIDFEDLHQRDYSPLLKLQQLPNFEEYFKREDFMVFCFVRNPYSRLLSCYLDKICNPTNFKKKVLERMGFHDKDIARPISFREFIGVIEQQTPLEMDYHWRHQTFLTCVNQINYDFIGRLETFSEDFNSIGGKLCPDFNKYYSPEIRHQTNAKSLLGEYYTRELYNRVYDIYEEDFKTFSYGR